MFSYLRSNNRRSAVPPTTSYNAPVRYYHNEQVYSADLALDTPSQIPDDYSPSPISPDPPILPPIPRVASQREPNIETETETREPIEESIVQSRRQSRLQETRGSSTSSTSAGRPSMRIVEDDHGYGTLSNEGMPPQHFPLQQKPQYQNRQMRSHHPDLDSMRSYSEPLGRHVQSTLQEKIFYCAEPSRAPPPPPLKISSNMPSGTGQGRSGKTRLNLLNPMSLLARRRSHQAVAEATSERNQQRNINVPALGLPDDYDPRIRGKVVHDFSAPRPGRNGTSSSARGADPQREAFLYGSRRTSPNPSTAFVDEESPSSGEREHTPQFKEHFDDDVDQLKDAPSKRRTSAFMYHVSLNESHPDPDPSVLPPFARNLPSTITSAPESTSKASSPLPKKSLDVVPEATTTDALLLDKSLPSTPPTSPPIKGRSRASSNTDPSFQPAGLPKHFKSNASRFSFDLAGVGSAAQEQLLEEKHRQNERKKARHSNESGTSQARTPARDPDDEDDYSDDYNDIDDEDDLEEKIPGVNTDADDYARLEPHSNINFISPNKSSFASEVSPVSTGLTSPNTPRDSNGHLIDLCHSDISKPDHDQTLNSVVSQDDNQFPNQEEFHDTNAHSDPTDTASGVEIPTVSREPSEEDDLYFDDGMIDDVNEQEDQSFDESVFDDDTSRIYGLPLRELKPLPQGGSFQQEQRSEQPFVRTRGDSDTGAQNPQEPNIAFAESRDSFTELNQGHRPSFSQTAGLTQDNLAAYHDALALAANRAALEGKFTREPSQRLIAEARLDSEPGLSSDYSHGNGQLDSAAGGLLLNGGVEDTEYFNFDDSLEDDPIVAAANAEALENDDEGFYGQEFGFFARASAGADVAVYANGGYFGSRALEGPQRSHSGRVNEPSLTPITERSEWSNRNSAISLAMHGYQPHSAGPLPSPGLAQLADMMQMEEDSNMSLSALLKLRRGAWGGSNASLQSSSSGSPLTYVPGIGFPSAIPMQHSNSSNSTGNANLNSGSPLTMNSAHNFGASSYSLNSSNGVASSNEDSQPSPASATITLASQQQALQIQQPPQSAPPFLPQQHQAVPVLAAPYVQQRRSTSPVKRSSMGPPKGKGHSRNSSSTSETVSYVMEKGVEEGSQGRWVLEKRRIGEGGVVEVLGREVVEGGRI